MDTGTFNPALLRWLNERDYCSGDWPYDVPNDLLLAADVYFGGGYILDEYGYPVIKEAHRTVNHHAYDPLHAGA